MRFVNLKNILPFFAALLLAVQLVGVVFCGDTDCLQGGTDENCDALICGLLGKHGAANPAANDGLDNSCQCVCHLLIDVPQITLNAVLLAATPFHVDATLRLISSSVRSIYHPPLA